MNIKRIVAGALLSGGVAVAGLGLAAGAAQADNAHTWCPGQSLWITGNHVTNPVVWDESICHTYYVVYWGQGNVAQNIWDGPDPPPPPPPGPPPIISGDQCRALNICGLFP